MNINRMRDFSAGFHMAGMRGGRMPQQGSIDPGRLVQQKDQNGDGGLNINETRLSEEKFAKIDGDGDGMISQSEIESVFDKISSEISSKRSMVKPSFGFQGGISAYQSGMNYTDSFIENDNESALDILT